MREGSGGRRQSIVMLAGWLFADLAVGLVIILLATATDVPVAAPAPPSSPSASPTPTTSPSPTPEPEPPARLGLEDEPFVFEVRSNANALLRGDEEEVDRVARAIRRELRPYEEEGRRAGFILTWGASPTPGEGVALAEVANDVLREAVPDLTDGAAVRDLWRGGGVRRGTLIFEVFLFVEG